MTDKGSNFVLNTYESWVWPNLKPPSTREGLWKPGSDERDRHRHGHEYLDRACSLPLRERLKEVAAKAMLGRRTEQRR